MAQIAFTNQNDGQDSHQETLLELLTASRPSSRPPYFGSLAEISRLVFDAGATSYQDIVSLTASLSHILKGKRPSPPALRRTLIGLISERLANVPEEERHSVLARVEAMLPLKSRKREVAIRHVRANIESVLMAIQRADEIVMIMPQIAFDDPACVYILTSLTERLSEAEQATCSIYFDRHAYVNSFWLQMRSLIQLHTHVESKGVEPLLQQWQEMKRLNVAILDGCISTFPVIVLNPQSQTKREGFNVYLGKNTASVCKILDGYLMAWHDTVFSPLRMNLIKTTLASYKLTGE